MKGKTYYFLKFETTSEIFKRFGCRVLIPGESCLASAVSCKYLNTDWLTALSFIILTCRAFDKVNYFKFMNLRHVK